MKTAPIFRGAAILNHRVNAGVLQLALGISLVVSIICSSMILVAYFSKLLFLNQSIQDRLRDNAVSGIQYGMAMKKEMFFSTPLIVDLFGEETDSVELIRKPWGIFEILVSDAWRGSHHGSRTALLTAMPDAIGKSIIYSPDNNAPLYLVGNAKLEGTAYVSERKFSTGYINRRGYEGEKLISGEVRKSEADIPRIDTVLLHAAHTLMAGSQKSYRINTLSQFPFRQQFSFRGTDTNLYFSDQSIDVSDSIGGNLIVQSSIKVRVTADARLNDVILIAPEIDIDKGFEGSVQCFATHSITIGSDCKLKYPSALVLLESEKDSLIVVGQNTLMEGVVVIPGKDQSISSDAKFTLMNRAILHGMIYVNGEADIRGAIWGHITAKQFIAMSGSSEYRSHILDAEITDQKRSRSMPGSLLWANTNELTIAKWLE